jgi:cupin 2 domain-containing protein
MAEQSHNLLLDLPNAQTGEVFTELLARPGLRIERIVSAGQSSKERLFYDQEQSEWILLLQGCAQLELEVAGQMQCVTLQQGSFLHIPARCRHRVLSTSKQVQTVWLAIHFNEKSEA